MRKLKIGEAVSYIDDIKVDDQEAKAVIANPEGATTALTGLQIGGDKYRINIPTPTVTKLYKHEIKFEASGEGIMGEATIYVVNTSSTAYDADTFLSAASTNVFKGYHVDVIRNNELKFIGTIGMALPELGYFDSIGFEISGGSIQSITKNASVGFGYTQGSFASDTVMEL